MVGGASRDRRPAQVRWAAAGRPDNFSSIRHYHQYAESGGYWIRGSVRFLTNMHLRKQASTHNESLKDQSGSVVPHRHLCPAGRRSSTLSGADPSAVAPVKRGDLRTDLRSRSNLMNDRSCREDHQKAPQQHCDQKPTRASSCQPANSAAKARNRFPCATTGPPTRRPYGPVSHPWLLKAWDGQRSRNQCLPMITVRRRPAVP
jgi:hypothetical protein